jgi:hypothetical protein
LVETAMVDTRESSDHVACLAILRLG